MVEIDIICPHCGQNIFEGRFVGYVAIPSNNQDLEMENNAHEWVIEKKDFWDKNHNFDSNAKKLGIPDFSNIQAGTYIYIGIKPLTVKEQAKELEFFGFQVLPISAWRDK